ncbi:MAG TPA: hypothetical protein DEA80_11585, partial [Afipia sp.]|nr:hypothetical protein [Afipia sp.]
MTDATGYASSPTLRRLTRGAVLPLSLVASTLHIAGIAPAFAQGATKQVAAPDPEAIKQRTQELEAARDQQRKAAE